MAVVDPRTEDGWDEALGRFPPASLFHTAAWARAVSEAYGFTPVYFVRHDGDGGQVSTVLPLMEVDSWLTGRRGISLPFSDECAPLGADSDKFPEILDAAMAHGRSRGWKYLESRGGRAGFGSAPASASFLGHTLDLTTRVPKLIARFDASVRQAVRKAEGAGLTVDFSRDMQSVRTFYDLHCQTRRRLGTPPQPFRFFACLHRHVLGSNLGWVALAKLGPTPVAGAVYLHFGRTVLFKYGASDRAFQHLRPNNLVMSKAIEFYAERGFSSLDFGRTSPQDPGLRRFKLGWGSTERAIDYVRLDPRTGSPCRFGTDRSPEWARRAFTLLPARIGQWVGSALYKHAA